MKLETFCAMSRVEMLLAIPRLPLGPNIRPFLPTRRVKMLPPTPNVHASHLTCDNQKVLHLLILLLLAE
jgi:hypothetical protein